LLEAWKHFTIKDIDSSAPYDTRLIDLSMSSEITLGIIKPDAVERNIIGKIISQIELAGLRVIALRYQKINRDQAARFYAEHKDRPFFEELLDTMTAGPVVLMALQGPDAIRSYRTVMGATDPSKAEEGTIRRLYAKSVGQNSVHGSDSPESAKRELSFFFSGLDIAG